MWRDCEEKLPRTWCEQLTLNGNRSYHDGMQKQEAIQYYGNANRLAKALGVSRQAVYAWKGPEVPPPYQYKLHYLTDGKLPLSPELSAKAGQ
jgi:hypothetical protein